MLSAFKDKKCFWKSDYQAFPVFASQHYRCIWALWGGGGQGPLLLCACDSGKDVRDPAAEMTFVLPSCGSIPTSSPCETAGENDICIECIYQYVFLLAWAAAALTFPTFIRERERESSHPKPGKNFFGHFFRHFGSQQNSHWNYFQSILHKY